MENPKKMARSLPESSEILVKFFKGLADPTRLRIIEALLQKDHSVTELVSRVGVPQSNVSNHLACLKWCGYITSRKQGTSIYYRITDDRIRKIMTLGREVVACHAENLYACTRIKD